MLQDETLKELHDLFPLADFVDVVTVQAILHATVAGVEDSSGFDAKVAAIFASLPDGTKERGTVAMERLWICEEFEMNQSLHGMGGYVAKSLADMFKEKDLL